MCEIPEQRAPGRRVRASSSTASRSARNDLTQLTLGVDRDSEILAQLFDERDPAVKRADRDASSRARTATRPQGRHLRPGAERPPGLRRVAGRARHRQPLALDRRRRATRLRVAEIERRREVGTEGRFRELRGLGRAAPAASRAPRRRTRCRPRTIHSGRGRGTPSSARGRCGAPASGTWSAPRPRCPLAGR